MTAALFDFRAEKFELPCGKTNFSSFNFGKIFQFEIEIYFIVPQTQVLSLTLLPAL